MTKQYSRRHQKKLYLSALFLLILYVSIHVSRDVLSQVTVGIVACVEKTTTTTTAGESAAPTTSTPPSTTGTLPPTESTPAATQAPSTAQEQSTTTTTLPPTTTTMKYCEDTNGMNRPLDIQPGQVTSQPPSENKPGSSINPTTTKPGLDFPSDKPQINITLNEPQEINTIYVPNNRPTESTNVKEFTVQFLYPNGTLSPVFTSVIPSTSGTTTPSTGAGSESTTTPSTVNGVVPPSDSSPQVQLPENFDVPKGTVIIFTVKKTTDNSPATGVCMKFLCRCPLLPIYR